MNDYILTQYELKKLFKGVLDYELPPGSELSRSFVVGEQYYLTELLEQLALLTTVGHASTEKFTIMNECSSVIANLAFLYSSNLPINYDPEFEKCDPSEGKVKTDIDGVLNAENTDLSGETEFKHDIDGGYSSEKVNKTLNKQYDISEVIFVRSLFDNNVLYIIPKATINIVQEDLNEDGTSALIFGLVRPDGSNLVLAPLFYLPNMDERGLIEIEALLALSAINPKNLYSIGVLSYYRNKLNIPILTLPNLVDYDGNALINGKNIPRNREGWWLGKDDQYFMTQENERNSQKMATGEWPPLEFNVQPEHNIRWANINKTGVLKTIDNIMETAKRNDHPASFWFGSDPIGRGYNDSQTLNCYFKTYANSEFYRNIVEYHKGVSK